MVAEVVSEIEEQAATERGDRPVVGVGKILSQDACRRPRKTKKSPAPMLFFAERKETRDALANTYKDFVDEYELAADRLIQAALRGYRLDPSLHFPTGSFPPAVIDGLLKAADGFNPEREFPSGSFPRAWPFVGGRLGPAPPIPPTRLLIYKGAGRSDDRSARRDPDGSRSPVGPPRGRNPTSRSCQEPGASRSSIRVSPGSPHDIAVMTALSLRRLR